MSKVMDHADYPKRLKAKSTASLYYIMRDAKEAAAAMPEGENVGYYLDEVSYCGMEIKLRHDKATTNGAEINA